ncbi:MAG: helix-turn-helix transcriptional regulator [Acidobacteriaceae bacterium]|nr:helix-turn-helix transcriptional regulator [Acidobacteriaceae bacterium]
MMGLSQERVAELLGVTFQQVQKYERGANRVSASRLLDLSRVLNVPITFFFDDMPSSPASAYGGSHPAGIAAEACSEELLSRRETLELVRAYCRIGNASIRKAAFELIKSMSSPEYTKNQAIELSQSMDEIPEIDGAEVESLGDLLERQDTCL